MQRARARPPQRWAMVVRVLAQRWWRAVTGGRFFTWWSALVSLPAALTALGAFAGVDAAAQLPAALLASLLSWMVCVVVVLPAAWAERLLVSSGGRAVAVLAAVVVVSVLRPPLNDLLFGGSPVGTSIAEWPLRMLTNAISWLVLMSMVAVAVDTTVTATAVNRRLREALAVLGGGGGYDDTMRRARARVVFTVGELRRRVDALRHGVVDFERVRGFSEDVRAASHRLDAGADQATSSGTVGLPSMWARLAPPPVGFVGVLYIVASIPYASHILPPLELLACALALLAVAVIADLLLRIVARRRAASTRGILIVVFAVVTGAVLSLAFLPVVDGPVALISLLAFPLLTVLAAIAEAAILRSDNEQRWLTQALAAVRGPGGRSPGSAPEVLRAAAASLHGAVQGRCVVFAATLDDDVATREQTETFIAAVHRALDHVVSPQDRGPEEDPLGALLSVWSQVMQIDCDIDLDAATGMRDPATARQVADIASEAFVNAVKHSAAKQATVRLRATGPRQQRCLEVEVASPGVLRGAVRRRGVGQLGRRARLTQRGREVVLVAVVPVGAR
ncbi:MAG: hypothetical protein QM626_03530 [Microbacterium sp.]|uniref:hypothetical protein n=1 Tax=Microbacterium sp. TaxID=51671 RepID=UPI0039E37290